MKNQLIHTAIGFGTAAMAASAAAVNKQCPMQGGCFSLNVPETSANDVFIQITGPTSNAYMAVGTGSQMDGSTMLVVYPSSNGNNVTLSGRKGNGHKEPAYSPDVQATLLDGSGVSGGVMTANIRCSSCGPASANWIWASVAGSPIKSDSPSEKIKKHSDLYGPLSFDLASAKGGSSANPFSAGGDSGAPSSGGAGGASSGGKGSGGSGGSPTSGGGGKKDEGSGSASAPKKSGGPAVSTGAAAGLDARSFMTLALVPASLSVLLL